MSASPLFVFAGGGTGGHLYPALALIEWLRKDQPNLRFQFWCTQRRIDAEILGHADVAFVTQPVQPIVLRPRPLVLFYRAWRASTALCRERFEADRPAVVVGTGGYGSGPAVHMAHALRIPTALLNPDAAPGRANRYLAGKVDAIYAQWPETAGHFRASAKVIASGCPVRKEFHSPPDGSEHGLFGLDSRRQTLLVTGASSGARSINDAFAELAPDLSQLVGWQLLHLSGQEDAERLRQAYSQARVRAVVLPYTHQMAAALKITSLAVARSGAVSLAELAATATPAILMPYPYHRDMHQIANAQMLAARGAALVVPDAKDPAANAAALRRVLLPLMRDAQRLQNLRSSARRHAGPNPTQAIAEHLLQLARGAMIGVQVRSH